MFRKVSALLHSFLMKVKEITIDSVPQEQQKGLFFTKGQPRLLITLTVLFYF